MGKRSLRRETFARVRELSAGEKAAHAETICRHLCEEPAFLQAGTVFTFAALASEPDLDRLRQDFPEKTWGLSRVADDGISLHFHRITSDEQLTKSPFGFPEPDPSVCPVIHAPDLILIPGVAFDPVSKARLGRGKGHYDRYLAPLRDAEPPPLLIGVSFSVQWLTLAPEGHDIPMDRLVSEEGFC